MSNPLPRISLPGLAPEVVETIAARLEETRQRALTYGPALIALTFVSRDDIWPVFASWVEDTDTTTSLGYVPSFAGENGQAELAELITMLACWLAVHAPVIADALREELNRGEDPGPGEAPVG